MIVTMNSMSIWILIVLSLLLSLVVSIGILYYFCCKRSTGSHNFYVLEDNKKLSSLNVFHHFNMPGGLKDNAVFTSASLPIIVKDDDDDNQSLRESSEDCSEKFDKSMLVISKSRKDDMESCISETSSRRSFYSTFTQRQNSQADTYISIE